MGAVTVFTGLGICSFDEMPVTCPRRLLGIATIIPSAEIKLEQGNQ